MKIFLTGGTGFVGSHLIDRLLNENHDVYALIRSPEKIKNAHPRLHLIKGDLAYSFTLSEEMINSIEVVIHAAGIVHSYDSKQFFEINTKGTKNLIDKFITRKTALKFILISSLAARGPIENIESPVSDYGRSKKDAETLLNEYAPSSWTKIIIRPPMVIGPRDPAVLDIFKMVKDRVILLPGLKSLQKKYSFVCVHDLVETITLSLFYNKNALFYSSYKISISFQELIDEIRLYMPRRAVIYLAIPEIIISIFAKMLQLAHKLVRHELRLTPDKTMELFPSSWVCSSDLVESELKQVFSYSLKNTIEITYVDYKSRKWL